MNRPAGLATLALAAMLCACSAGRAQPAPSLVESGPLSFAPLVRRVVPAVVNIAVTESLSASDAMADMPSELRGTPFEKQFRNRMRNRREQVMGAGSGFIIDPSGVIVTNNHVVGHAETIVVSMTDGTEMPAHLVGADALTDIAVIKVDPPDGRVLPFVTWGDSTKVDVGDWILAAGNPFGLGSSVTAGIVSARGRDIGAGPFDDFMQLDAPINPGNSGGPTFNMAGQVVAVNTAIVSPTGGSVGIGFAIPSQIAQPIVATLRAKGSVERGWLGVSVPEQAPGKAGVTLEGVDPSGPAGKAGLRRGDVVVAVNGMAVNSSHGLISAVSAVSPNSTVRLDVRRAGQAMTVNVTVGLRKAGPD